MVGRAALTEIQTNDFHPVPGRDRIIWQKEEGRAGESTEQVTLEGHGRSVTCSTGSRSTVCLHRWRGWTGGFWGRGRGFLDVEASTAARCLASLSFEWFGQLHSLWPLTCPKTTCSWGTGAARGGRCWWATLSPEELCARGRDFLLPVGQEQIFMSKGTWVPCLALPLTLSVNLSHFPS
jgi:hypothetical protein